MYKCVSLEYLRSDYVVSNWVASQTCMYMECFVFVTVHSGAEYQHLYSWWCIR